MKTVLVSITDPAILDLVDRTLRARGWQTVCVSNTDEATRTIADCPNMNVILIDLNNPPGGAEAVVAVARSQNPPIPVLVTSGSYDDNRIQNLRTEFVLKGCNTWELEAALNKTIFLASPAPIRLGLYWTLQALAEEIFFSLPPEAESDAGAEFLWKFKIKRKAVLEEIARTQWVEPHQVHELRLGTDIARGEVRKLIAELQFFLEYRKKH